MEILLAIVVASAVIFFGALISMGNERQRKAIDDLREQITLWAIQDIHIKREHLVQDTRVDNPLEWFNMMAAKILGQDLDLQFLEFFELPIALICSSENGDSRVIFSPLSPTDIHKIHKEKRGRLSHYANRNPLLLLPRNTVPFEVSVLNSEIFLDIKLPLAWKALTGQEVNNKDRIWMYYFVINEQ